MLSAGTIGERIRTCRKEKGFTQEKLSQLIHVSHQTIMVVKNETKKSKTKV